MAEWIANNIKKDLQNPLETTVLLSFGKPILTALYTWYSSVRCSDMLRVNKRSVLNVTVYLPVEWGIPACFSSLVMVCLVKNQIIGVRYSHQRLVVVCKVVKVPSWWPLTTLGGHQEGTLMCRVFSVLILLLLCNTAFMHVDAFENFWCNNLSYNKMTHLMGDSQVTHCHWIFYVHYRYCLGG